MEVPWVIIIASADGTQEDLFNVLKQMNLEAICTSTVSECLEILRNQPHALAFCDRGSQMGITLT